MVNIAEVRRYVGKLVYDLDAGAQLVLDRRGEQNLPSTRLL